MKKNYYEFPKTTTSFNIMYDVDIIKGHSIIDIDTDFQFTSQPSNNIKNLLDDVGDYFYEDLYDFVKNYNTKFKNIKMKKEYHSTNGMSGKPDAPIMVFVEMKRGKCYVSYSPLLQEDDYDYNCMDTFIIKTDDMLKFLNKWSKKTNFQNSKDEIEVEKTDFVVYRISVNGVETYDVLTQDPWDIGSAISVKKVISAGKDLPMSQWEKIEELLKDNY